MSTTAFLTSPTWVTSTNHSPLVKTVAEVFVVSTFISVIARLATRYAVLRSIHLDDCTISIAFLCALGQTVAIIYQSDYGLGKPISMLSEQSIIGFQKSEYAASLLYILAIGFTKVSVCWYFSALTPNPKHRRVIMATGLLCIVWSMAFLLSAPFQCSPPTVWKTIDNPKCINIVNFWTVYHIVNILTDALLIYIPFLILLGLQMRTDRKVTILMCFATRVTVIVATVVQIFYLRRDIPSTSDATNAHWPTVLVTTLVQALSIVTACLPYLKPFLESLESGIIGHGISSAGSQAAASRYAVQNSNGYAKSGSQTGRPSLKAIGSTKIYPMNGYSHRSSAIGNPSSPTSHTHSNSHGIGHALDGQSSTATAIWSNAKRHTRKTDNDADETGSQSSQSHIIKKTIGWAVSDDQGIIASDERAISSSPPSSMPPMPTSPQRQSKETVSRGGAPA